MIIKTKISDKELHELLNICNYFEKVWVGVFDSTDNEKILVEPMYKIEFWNTYDRILHNIPRTFNTAETWNRVLNFRSEVAHPNIEQFINELFNKEEAYRFNIKRTEQGKFGFLRDDLVKERKIYTFVNNYKDVIISINKNM